MCRKTERLRRTDLLSAAGLDFVHQLRPTGPELMGLLLLGRPQLLRLLPQRIHLQLSRDKHTPPHSSSICRTVLCPHTFSVRGRPGSNETGSLPALNSQELNSRLIFPVHFVLCFSSFCCSLSLLGFCLSGPSTCILGGQLSSICTTTRSRNVTTCVLTKTSHT